MDAENISDADIFSAASEPARDDAGRFAPQERPPETHETRPAEQETPTPNLGQMPDQGSDGGRSEPDQGQPQGQPEQAPPRQPQLVPLSEVQSERKKRQAFEADLAARDRELAEMRGQMAAYQQFMARQGQPQQRQDQPEASPPDPFGDPDGFAAWKAQQVFQQQFAPIAQRLQQQEAQYQRTVSGMQRSLASVQYGADKVREAEEAFNTAAARGAIDPHEHARINGSENPYGAAVEWLQRQRAYEQVGSDPQQWFTTELERRAKSDPAFQQQIFALLNGQAQSHQAASVPGAAAGRSPPVFVPPSVNGAAGASARGAASISEDDIFAAAPPKMGGRG